MKNQPCMSTGQWRRSFTGDQVMLTGLLSEGCRVPSPLRHCEQKPAQTQCRAEVWSRALEVQQVLGAVSGKQQTNPLHCDREHVATEADRQPT